MKKRVIAWILLPCLLLSGCAARQTDHETSGAISLPEPEIAQSEMILGEAAAETAFEATLYCPSSESVSLTAVTRTLSVRGGESVVRRVLEELLSPSAGDLTSIAPGDTKLLGLEVSGGLVTVNLSIDALNAPDQEDAMLTLAAVANTLLALEGVDAVNVLIGGVAPDVWGMPLGVLTQPIDSVAAALAQFQNEYDRSADSGAITRHAALYFLSNDGRWLAPEIRQIDFAAGDYVSELVARLKTGPLTTDCACTAFPDGTELLLGQPSQVVTSAGEKVIDVNLSRDIDNYLSMTGHDMGQLLASLVLTVTSFAPQIDGVRVSVDGAALDRYALFGEEKSIPDGILRRKDFSRLVGALSTMYLSGEDGMLARVQRAVSQGTAGSAAALLSQLLDGPLSCETDVRSPFPAGVSAADLLGVSVDGRIAAVNLSGNFYRLCQDLDSVGERNAVYAIVNTLCGMDNIGGVRIVIEGLPSRTLTRNIYLRSVLLPNPGIVTG